MKIIRQISIFSLIIILFACSEETPAPTKTELLSRKWTTDKVSGVVSGLTLSVYDKATNTKLLDFSGFYLTFTKDGNVTLQNITGQPIQGKWVFEQNESVVNINKSEYVLTIQELTDAKLTFKMPFTITTDDFKSFGIAKGAKVDATFVMIGQ
jgi:hypothetical protein